jgi:hypothetical protein
MQERPLESIDAAPARPPRLVAFGFTLAFAASVLTVVYTGLLAKARGPGGAPRELTLYLRSPVPLADATVAIELPPQAKLLDPPPNAANAWRATLAPGASWLRLRVQGEARWVDVRVEHGGKQRWFTIDERNATAVRTGDLPLTLDVGPAQEAAPQGTRLELASDAAPPQ